MTTAEMYNASVNEFAEHVQDEYDYYESLGYSIAQCSLFSVLATEIFFLKNHYEYLRSRREERDWGKKLMWKTLEVQKKMESKQRKLKRYEEELL